jgi:Helicase associated domain
LSMLQHLNANAQPPSQFLRPAFMGTDPLASLFISNGMHNSMVAPVVTQHAFGTDVSRLLVGGGQETNERHGNVNEDASNRTLTSTLGVPTHCFGQQEQSSFAYAEFGACTGVGASAAEHQVNGVSGLQTVNSETNTLSPLSPHRKLSAAAKETKSQMANSENGGLSPPSPPRKMSAAAKETKSPDLKPPPRSKKRSAEDQPRKSKKKDTKWLTTLEELKIYKQENGNTIVPRGYSQNPRLASWVAEQRKQVRLSRIPCIY